MKYLFLIIFSIISVDSFAGEADVTNVTYECSNQCTFSVSVLHADDGWDHFANRWEILTLSGEIIATRMLAHPHAKNVPFTRSLSNIKLPENTTSVIVRAHDSVHGYGGKEITIQIKRN